jgi:Bax protein
MKYRVLSCISVLGVSFLAMADVPPDFSSIVDVNEKKNTFFSYIAPMVEKENQIILQERAILINGQDTEAMKRICEKYSQDCNEVQKEKVQTLLMKVDVIPPALVLAQAANESAWGTSRFARKANNYFGQWCFSKGCGLVPSRRDEGTTHEVRQFNSTQASIASYMLNLNTGHAYEEFRQIRSEKRSSGQRIIAHDLVQGLSSYSSRGQAYIQEIRAMIRYNKLEKRFPLKENLPLTINS